jgi:hypothetical protein
MRLSPLNIRPPSTLPCLVPPRRLAERVACVRSDEWVFTMILAVSSLAIFGGKNLMITLSVMDAE